ncbi:beta-glucosidase 12-like [Corylus avellana]|uniref:beta-glucosidase 12-like n=1 Tax=Corylus avellana TaxID=13451 RepID=UPI001E1EBB1C|nr:beta-glucosidase 12-like [Corylus avellana]
MAFERYLVLGLLVLHVSLTNTIAVRPNHYSTASLSRSSFPEGFIFGTASASYQFEGAAKEDGKGASIWDTYTHTYPGKITDHSTGDVAVDQYHRYKEDVHLMKKMGLDGYRLSISWSRVLPNGKLSGGVNREGIKYYNNLINELLAKGVKPFVTLFHWDLPQALEDEYGGFLSPQIVHDFRDYAELCFNEFGDRVKNWVTINEPTSYSLSGYEGGSFAPGRCSDRNNCAAGNSSTEPYLVIHHELLAHAAAVEVYRQKYQAKQKGCIGIVLVASWAEPYSNTRQDRNAALRNLDFVFGWLMDPLTNGDYPRSMQSLVGNRLPKFSKEQSNILNGSFDFIGLNYYTTSYAANAPQPNAVNASHTTDMCVNRSNERNGIPIGPKAASDWLYVYPRGIHNILLYTKRKYNNPLIYVTENGIDDASLSLEEAFVDKHRIDYFYHHLKYVNKAIKHGVNVKGYFAWALTDNFEWINGYTFRFGMYYVDYKNGLKRHPKLSAHWFKSFLKK